MGCQEMTERENLPILPPLNNVPLTANEIAAALFVKHLAADVDAKRGHAPTRETQRKVAGIVREAFFDAPVDRSQANE